MDRNTRATLALLAGNGIFGFSFLFSKLALDMTTPFTLLSVRFITAFVVLNLLLLTKKVSISLKGKPVGMLLLLGIVQPVLYFICETYGIAKTSSSFSGVMIGLAPVMGLICGVVFLKEKCTIFQVLCTLLSVVGVALTTTGGFGQVPLVGALFLLGAVVTAALFTVLSRSVAPYFSAYERTYVMIGMGSIVLDGAVLEEDCLVGACAVVTGKVHAPAGSVLLGNPARIVRQLTAEQRLTQRGNATHYVELAKETFG